MRGMGKQVLIHLKKKKIAKNKVATKWKKIHNQLPCAQQLLTMAFRRLIPLLDRVLVEKVRGSAHAGLRPPARACARVRPVRLPLQCVRAAARLIPTPPPPPIPPPRPLPLARAQVAPAAKTTGGILLPESASKVNSAKVLAVGAGGRDNNGNLVPVSVKEGDTVLLPEYGGTQVKLADGKEYVRATRAESAPRRVAGRALGAARAARAPAPPAQRLRLRSVCARCLVCTHVRRPLPLAPNTHALTRACPGHQHDPAPLKACTSTGTPTCWACSPTSRAIKPITHRPRLQAAESSTGRTSGARGQAPHHSFTTSYSKRVRIAFFGQTGKNGVAMLQSDCVGLAACARRAFTSAGAA